jgi:hypothetical protein
MKQQEVKALREFLRANSIDLERKEPFIALVNQIRAKHEESPDTDYHLIGFPDSEHTVYRFEAIYDKSSNSWHFDNHDHSKRLNEAIAELTKAASPVKIIRTFPGTTYKGEWLDEWSTIIPISTEYPMDKTPKDAATIEPTKDYKIKDYNEIKVIKERSRKKMVDDYFAKWNKKNG